MPKTIFITGGSTGIGAASVFANAGIHRSNTLLDVADEQMDLMIQTNIYGTVNTLREAVPEIIRTGKGSVVINASDQWFVGKPNSFVYGLTKGALGQITRSLSIDLAKYNIRVNAVCAGTTRTPLVDNLFKEFAELVYFLAGDSASFCTGGHYLVDGGLVAK